MIAGKIKKKFPKIYHSAAHLKRLIAIRKMEKLKKYSEYEKKEYIANMYKARTGEMLDWNNLKTYTEKMQWAKLYECCYQKTVLSDKYLVREWITEKIGDDYLIPLLGVWDKFDDIDFTKLPEKFVLKTNHGSGTNVIVRNKEDLDIPGLRRLFNDWMMINYAYNTGFEMQYFGIQRKIIVEKLIETANNDLQDYKFLCFGGKPYYCWVDIGRYSIHRRNVYDLNWNLQPWNQYHYGNYNVPIAKPQNFEKMIAIAEKLSQGFSHVRVDLYNNNGVIYFGEMTFTNSSGFELIQPHEYNVMLGLLWNINC